MFEIQGSVQGQATDWHSREPGLIHRVRQLADMEESQASVTGSGTWLSRVWHFQCVRFRFWISAQRPIY
jgi:hypothetical protein